MAHWANLGCMANTLSPEFPLPITPAIVAFLLLALGKALGSRSPEQGILVSVSLRALRWRKGRSHYADGLRDAP